MSRSERGGKLRKGAWTAEEDMLLRKCVEKYGEGKWRYVPERSGLRRCRKSCRLRWLNYLCPRINREKFSDEEDDLIIRLHKILGNRWSLIAGRLPGRTANDVKNYWNSHLSKKVRMMTKKANVDQGTSSSTVQVVRPQPRRVSVPLNLTASSSQSQEETAQAAYCGGQPPSKTCTLGLGTCSVPEDDLAWISSMIHGGEENWEVGSWLGLDADHEKDGEEEEDQEGLSIGGTEEWDALKEWEDLLNESTATS